MPIIFEGMENTNKLLPAGPMARRLHVPIKWLRNEALEGRLPHVKAGTSILFDPVTIESILLERARGKGVQNDK